MLDIENRLLDTVAKSLGVDKSKLHLSNTLGEDIPCDSLQFYNLIIEIEMEFDVEFDPALLSGFKNLTTLCNYLDQHSSN